MFMIVCVCVGVCVMVNKSGGWISPQLMDSHQQRKHKRIKAIAEIIESRRKVNYKQFLAEMQYHGLRQSVAEEYVELLKDLGLIKLEKEDILWNGENEDKKPDFDNQKQRGEKP